MSAAIYEHIYQQTHGVYTLAVVTVRHSVHSNLQDQARSVPWTSIDFHQLHVFQTAQRLAGKEVLSI